MLILVYIKRKDLFLIYLLLFLKICYSSRLVFFEFVLNALKSIKIYYVIGLLVKVYKLFSLFVVNELLLPRFVSI